jgi:RND family efflux transporter MFP subunit
LLAGCTRAAATTGTAKDAANEVAKRVVVIRPRRQDVLRTVTQPATVLALNEATLFSQVAGYLSSIRVDKGDTVKRGDVIATIEVPELLAERAQLAAAEAQARAELAAAVVELERTESSRLAAEAGHKRAIADLALKKSLYERAKDLHTDHVVSDQDLEVAEGGWKESAAALSLAEARVREAEAVMHEAEARIAVGKAKVETATAQLGRVIARIDYSTIHSPLSGIVTRRYVDPGALIQQATASSTQASPIVVVDDIDRVRVDFQVPEKDVAWVASGQTVTLALDVDAYEGRTFVGSVTRFAGALDTSRTMLVEAEYENRDHTLRPGMFGRATLETGRHPDALTVPAEAVVTKDGGRFLHVVTGGRVHRRQVTVGFDRGATVEITKGLAPDELVVIGGGHLTDDMPVVTVEHPPGTETKEEAK